MNLKEKHLVVTANSYTTAKHELTLNEEKLIFCAIVAVREFCSSRRARFCKAHEHR
jgi:hypothetical protein